MRLYVQLLDIAIPLAFVATGAHADVTISSQPTQNINCTGGICAPTASNAVLNMGDLETLLASGSVEVTTTGSGVQANNIAVKAAFSWSTGYPLTLDAYQSIVIDGSVSVRGLAGLTLTTNDDGTGGTLSFGGKGNVNFANRSSNLTINSTTYPLVNSIASLAKAIAANPSGSYALASNYDASHDGTYSSSPIATPFAGSFEGLGNKISSVSMDAPSSQALVGFFGQVAGKGIVRNLQLTAMNVVSSCVNYGGLCQVGGLAGDNAGTLSNDLTSGHLYANGYGGVYSVGGVAASNEGVIENSTSAVDVFAKSISTEGGANIGSLVGYNSGHVTDSSANGNVRSFGWGGFGGLAGQNDGTVTTSYATGRVWCRLGCGLAGGLIGEQEGMVSNCYAMGIVGGATEDSGGLVGRAYSGSIADSYAAGAVSGSNWAGGFAGEVDSVTTTFGYWDTTTSGVSNGVGFGSSNGITGLTTEQLVARLPKGFRKSIWRENPNINNGLPYLIANPPPK